MIGEQRAEPEFVERDIRMSLTEHEEFWHLNLIELRRLQGAVDLTTSQWRVTYFLRLVVFLFYIPLRRSFWAQMHKFTSMLRVSATLPYRTWRRATT